MNKNKLPKKRIFFLLCSAVLLIVTLVPYSLGWFTFNTQTGTDGMQMKATGKNYEIIMLDDSENGKWYDPYHEKIQEVSGSSALIWKITDDYNMDNSSKGESKGIKPGAAGSVSFYVSPKIDTVNLDFNFEIVGYRNVDENKSDEDIGTMETIAGAVANYLNGHILLFEKRTLITATGEYIYEGLIASDADMQRVLNKEFKKSDGDKQPVIIYWVWPKTLSTLVDARSCSVMSITQTPFTHESDEKNTRQAILENIQTYPQYYLKDVVKTTTTDDDENETVSYTTKGEAITSLSVEEISAKYDVYGDLYDQVDNDIGMNVNYVLLKMSVEEVAASTE